MPADTADRNSRTARDAAVAVASDRIMVIGLNPAWQKTLLFKELRTGEVNRAGAVIAQASGKGINFTWAVHQAGEAATVFQFSGGATGQALLADLEQRGLQQVTVATAGTTRTCTTVVSEADRRSTELIEPSATISPAEFAELRQAVLSRLPDVAGVALCGTFPPGVPATFYAVVSEHARNRAAVLLDAHGDILPALNAGPDIVKINAAELVEISGTADLVQAAAACLARFPFRWLAVTEGAGTAHLFAARHHTSFHLPALPGVVNTIGAGDCSSGTFLAAVVTGRSAVTSLGPTPATPGERLAAPEFVAEAFRASLACASASCLTPTPATFSPAQASALVSRITMERHAFP